VTSEQQLRLKRSGRVITSGDILPSVPAVPGGWRSGVHGRRCGRPWAVTVRVAVVLAVALACLGSGCSRASCQPAVQSDERTVGEAYGGLAPDGSFIYLSDEELNRQLDLIKRSGVRWIRLGLVWSVIETAPGRYDWTSSDRVISGAKARGLEFLGLVTYSPSWATGTNDDKLAPRDPAGIAPFVHAAAERYAAAGLHTWEVWNEPNLSGTWGPKPDPASYTQLLRAAASSIRSVDRSATVMVGGLSPAGDATDGSTISPLSFVLRLYAEGAGSFFDAIALHPYSFPSPPLRPGLVGNTSFQQLPVLHQAMSDHGDGAKKIWITEFGSPTGDAARAVSLKVQSESVIQAYSQVVNWPWAGPLFYYTLRDAGGNSMDLEQNFGLLRNDYSDKPAWAAFTGQMRQKLPSAQRC
jgi:polysaccharide biosynthesis protein PslG